MSALFDRLCHAHRKGHERTVDGLLTDERFAQAESVADAAVLIAITERDKPGVILTQRPQDMRSHPGQVAFPGGKIDPGEDAIAAALREAEEELAMPRDAVRVVGITDRYLTGTGFDVTPVIATIAPDLPLVPNPGEVEAWFEAPLSMLLDRQHWSEHEVLWRGAMRSYLQLDYQGFRIWGVTAAILANLAQRIAYGDLVD